MVAHLVCFGPFMPLSTLQLHEDTVAALRTVAFEVAAMVCGEQPGITINQDLRKLSVLLIMEKRIAPPEDRVLLETLMQWLDDFAEVVSYRGPTATELGERSARIRVMVNGWPRAVSPFSRHLAPPPLLSANARTFGRRQPVSAAFGKR
jgi:hypothetical protein